MSSSYNCAMMSNTYLLNSKKVSRTLQKQIYYLEKSAAPIFISNILRKF